MLNLSKLDFAVILFFGALVPGYPLVPENTFCKKT